MKKLTLAIGMALGMAVASTPALAEGDLFIAENGLDYTVYIGCGSHFKVLMSGVDTAAFACSSGITFQQYAGINPTALKHAHHCPDPESPVHRIRVWEATVTGGPVTELALGFSNSCEAAPS